MGYTKILVFGDFGHIVGFRLVAPDGRISPFISNTRYTEKEKATARKKKK